jgi:hypothetical protein
MKLDEKSGQLQKPFNCISMQFSEGRMIHFNDIKQLVKQLVLTV